jgi:hypothetical protein
MMIKLLPCQPTALANFWDWDDMPRVHFFAVELTPIYGRRVMLQANCMTH